MSEQNVPSAGQQLLEAREQKELSIEMVAQRLRLDVNLVHALEKDDYESFPAIAYARGYLRGYAKMVGLEPEQLISTLDQKFKATPPIEPFVSQPQQQTGSGDKHIKVVTYSLIALLVLLLGLWWQTQRSTEEMSDELETGETELQEKNVTQIELIEGTSGTLSLSAKSEEIAQEDPEELMHDFGVQQFSDLPEPPEQIIEAELPIREPIQDQAPENISLNSGNGQEVLPEISSTDTVQLVDQDIVIQFTDESWIQITDATGKKRFSRLGRVGEVVNVTGVAPFRVVIGRASVVIMSYQGNFLDLEPLAKNEVARFTLDETGAYR